MDDTIDVVASRDGVEVSVSTVPLGGRPARETLEEVARLSLAAHRLGCTVELRGAGARCVGSLLGLVVEVRGTSELLEEPGVEEVVVPDDPAV